MRHESRERPWLFKEVDLQSRRPLADDIVEKVASEISCEACVAAAHVDLVTRDAVRGCNVETLRPSKWDPYAGEVLIGAIVDSEDPADSEHPGHSVRTAHRALDGFEPPPGFDAVAEMSAFGVFAGYLIFDVLIANTDRHDRNWAALVPPPGMTVPTLMAMAARRRVPPQPGRLLESQIPDCVRHELPRAAFGSSTLSLRSGPQLTTRTRRTQFQKWGQKWG